MKKFILALAFVFFFQASTVDAAKKKNDYVGIHVSIFADKDLNGLVVSAKRVKNKIDEDFTNEPKFRVISIDEAGEAKEERLVNFKSVRVLSKCDPAAKGKCEGVRESKTLDLMMTYHSGIKNVRIFNGDKLLGNGKVR